MLYNLAEIHVLEEHTAKQEAGSRQSELSAEN
jgi:hypothetical protein